MEKFSLDTWLKDKSRKVVTRRGNPVRIICWDKENTSSPIVFLIKDSEQGCSYEYINCSNIEGKADSGLGSDDLFFADEEEKLTEFEKELEKFRTHILATSGEKYDKNGECVIKKVSKNLLDLARKELEKEIGDKCWEAHLKGEEEALKDLPKWKKATEHKDLEKHVAILEDGKVLLSNYLEKDDYYIDLEDLKTLPKEE